MKLMYRYNGDLIYFKCKNILKMENSMGRSIKRKLGMGLSAYVRYLGFHIDKCRVCGEGNPPIKIKYEIIDSIVNITGFDYTKEIYCYKNNTNCPGIKMNSNSIEFISIVKNITHEEAKVLLKGRNKSPFYRENWSSEESYQRSQSRNIEFYTSRYGLEEGEKRFRNHIDKISMSNSLEGYKNKYGNEIGSKRFNDISRKKDSMSLDFFIKKNDGNMENATQEYESRKLSVNVSLSSLINKYGYDVGIEKNEKRRLKLKQFLHNHPNREEIIKKMSISVDNLTRKYGCREIAEKKFQEWKEKVIVPFGRSSKESLKIFVPLMEYIISNLDIDKSDIYLGYGESKEFFLRSDTNFYLYDFTIKSKKIIIEFNGIVFHSKYENVLSWTHPYNKNISSNESFGNQQKKIDYARYNGFSVMEIWSDDDNGFEKCLEFIKNNIENGNS